MKPLCSQNTLVVTEHVGQYKDTQRIHVCHEDIWSCLFWQYFKVWVWHDFVHSTNTRRWKSGKDWGPRLVHLQQLWKDKDQQCLIRSHKSQSQQFPSSEELPKYYFMSTKVSEGNAADCCANRKSFMRCSAAGFCLQETKTETNARLAFETLLTSNSLSIICQHLSHRHMWWALWPTPLHSVT